MYTDDTVVYTHVKTAAKLTAALEMITHWLDQSCLSINVNKTRCMFSLFIPIFSSKVK